MSSLPPPPDVDAVRLSFPTITWAAQQPLTRIHRATKEPVFFARDPGGRFNPPTVDADFGTCYLSNHPLGSFAEVFGRFRIIDRGAVDARVLSQVYLPSDALLANLTHATVLGLFGITNELSTGDEVGTYPFSQRWAERFHEAGFAGVFYIARHDTTVQTRSVALFGKPGVDHGVPAATGPIDDADQYARELGYTIVSGTPI
jgi:RES domain